MKRTMVILMVVLTVLALTGTAVLAIGDLKGGPWPEWIQSGRHLA